MKASTVGRAHYTAECETCGWYCAAMNALAVASIHAEKKKHTVYVLKEQGIYFRGGDQ